MQAGHRAVSLYGEQHHLHDCSARRISECKLRKVFEDFTDSIPIVVFFVLSRVYGLRPTASCEIVRWEPFSVAASEKESLGVLD